MFVDINGLERGLARDFAYDVAPLFGVNDGIWDTSKKCIATLTLGWGDEKVVRDYNYTSGMAYIPKENTYRDIVSVNSDGYMEMERTDFYDSIGLNYVEFSVEFTVTKEHEIVQTAIYAAVGGVAGSIVPVKVGTALSSIVGGLISNKIQSGLII